MTSWLLDEPTDERAIQVIADSDILRSEAAMNLPAIRQQALRPATHDEIKQIIGSRFATLSNRHRTEGEAAAYWADCFAVLEGLTAAQIEAGMLAYLGLPDSEFIPKPGKLAHLARTAPSQGRWTRAYNRAREAVERQRRRAAIAAPEKPKAPPIPPEQVKALTQELVKSLREKDPFAQMRLKQKPTPAAKVDETGMSPEARALLESQGVIRPRANDHTRQALGGQSHE